MMTRSGARRASTAARTFSTISAASITSLPSMWPQRLGATWSSMCSAATPAASYSLTVRMTLSGLP
jgi:hypothetical protein